MCLEQRETRSGKKAGAAVLGLERFALWPLAWLLISSGVFCIVRTVEIKWVKWKLIE